MIDGVLVIYSNPEEGGTGDSGEGEGGFEGLWLNFCFQALGFFKFQRALGGLINGRGGLYPVGLITRLKEAFRIKLHSSASI